MNDNDGICKIKKEFILPEKDRQLILEYVSQKDQNKLIEDDVHDNDSLPSSSKKQKLSKKKLRGQNKSRGPTYRPNKNFELCNSLINLIIGEVPIKCEKKNCPCIHDIDEYLANKPNDIDKLCYNYETFGKCPRGLSCRFGNSHIENNRNKINRNQLNENKQTKNQLNYDLQTCLRKKIYDFKKSEIIIKYNDSKRNDKQEVTNSGVVTDEDVIKIISREKKLINWNDKLFLSPLTTLGNLPFRRICKEFGVDVTCSEMAMWSSLLQGAPQEWALVKRHHSETIFGVQICANNPHLLTKCGQLLDEQIDVDFIDLNLGCPIELIYKSGGGCALLRRPKILELCIRNLSDILRVPLTIKTRTGVYNNKNIVHNLASKFYDWGASLLTIHGRSREQRYTKLADWEYISQVAKAVAPMPVLGNGDILNYEDYQTALNKYPELTGVMIGRGALIKPWIFTEIKEQKLWDISSRERFDIIKKFTNYGLEHWGSDSKGVENTRRFLLEWLSFSHRYVPVGLLEYPPQKINERPPYYKGRDEMETWLASGSAADWIRLTETLLGKVPENFKFLPKHKANSYK